jgi:uncharacterized protein YlaN (UPF0358 family)
MSVNSEQVSLRHIRDVEDEVVSVQILGIASDAPFAVRLLTVDAVNQENVLSFYQRVGFIESLSDSKQRQAQKARDTVLMFKDLYQ